MKTELKLCRYGTAVLLLLGAVSTSHAVNVVVDPTQAWIGYMNVSELPANGGAYDFGSPWATAALDANFTGSKLILTPNDNIDLTDPIDAYWWQAPNDGSLAAAGNHTMDASMYVQNDALAGQTVTFSGTCLQNTLVSPYTSTIFIKDLSPSYGVNNVVTAPAAAGAFSITLATAAGDHIQYGFETVGPNARTAALPSLGNVEYAAVSKASVTVDPSQTWIGYMNVSELPANGGGYDFGSAWGTSALDANFSGSILTLTPNDNIDQSDPIDAYWWQSPNDGTTNSPGNHIMDASMYVQNDALAGAVVTFSGNVWNNSLVSPYTSTIFIKDFAADYSSSTSTTAPVVKGAFSITLATNPGDHIQYGFETVGPNARTALLPVLGNVVVASNAPPAGPIISSVAATPPVAIVGSNVVVSVTAIGSDPLTYQWKKNGVNLTGATSATLSLNNVSPTNEASYSVVVKDSTLNLSSTGAVYVAVENPAHLVVDPHAPYQGYMNFDSINGDGTPGGYESGQPFGTAALRASFVNGVVVLAPNTNLWETTDANFVSGGVSVRSCEADFYVQDDNLSGQTLTLTGYCPSNSLAGTLVSSVFIEDFNSSYALVGNANSNLVAGQAFTITLATNPGDHIQYGLRTDGPIEDPDGTLDPWGGSASTSSLVSIPLPVITASRAGNVTSLQFLTESGHNYTVQYKAHLTDASWTNVGTVIAGTGSTVTVTDTATAAARYYQLSVQ